MFQKMVLYFSVLQPIFIFLFISTYKECYWSATKPRELYWRSPYNEYVVQFLLTPLLILDCSKTITVSPSPSHSTALLTCWIHIWSLPKRSKEFSGWGFLVRTRRLLTLQNKIWIFSRRLISLRHDHLKWPARSTYLFPRESFMLG